MKKSAGFTLVELLVVLAIAAILLSLAAPSFTKTVRSVNMSSAVNSFLADASFARSEAVRRGGDVVMCRSNNPEGAIPTCASGSSNGWETGWIVFHDPDNSQTVTAGDLLLRRQAAITAVNSIQPSTTAKLVFTATGRLQSLAGGTMSMQFGSTPSYPNEEQRVVCVSLGGRVRIAGDGYASCS